MPQSDVNKHTRSPPALTPTAHSSSSAPAGPPTHPPRLDFPRLTLVSGNSHTVHLSRAARPPLCWHWALAAPSPPLQAFLQPLPLAALLSDWLEVALRQGESERSILYSLPRGVPKASLLCLPGVDGAKLQSFGTGGLTPLIPFSLVEQLKEPPVRSRDSRTRGQRGPALESLALVWSPTSRSSFPHHLAWEVSPHVTPQRSLHCVCVWACVCMCACVHACGVCVTQVENFRVQQS